MTKRNEEKEDRGKGEREMGVKRYMSQTHVYMYRDTCIHVQRHMYTCTET